jgi:ATP-binding cassette, subfamily B, bacterial
MAKISDIARYYRHYKGIAIFSSIAMCVMEIIDLFSPYGIGQLLNALSSQPLDGPMQSAIATIASILQQPVTKEFSILAILGMIGIISVGRAPIQPWLGPWFNWDTALKARRDHSKRALEKVLTLPLEFYDENNPGRIATRIGKGLSNHTWTYPEIVGNLIPKAVRVFGIFGVICFVDWRIAALLLISFVGILAHSLLGLKAIADREERLDKYIENTESRTSEIITNIKTVKAFATEADELRRQKQRLDREFVIADYRIHKSYVKLGMIERTIVQTCMFIVLAMTLISTMQGRISLGHFVTVLTVSSMAFAEVEPICNLAEIFARRYAAMIRFHEFMQLPTGQDAGSLVHTGQGLAYQFTGKIHFRQVNFNYLADRPILQNIDLLIQPKQTVALVGRSGSGKSTLVKLLFRYFDAKSGNILIDGQDIRKLDVSSYRKRLAIVHQEVDVFNGTLWENLLYGNRDATPEQVIEACRIAQADDFIRQLPQGYQTMVGERGVRLSGGQRQRLGIARALIMDPDVLVFDEATSSLDYESERAIQLAMKSLYGTRTMIIIAHRLSTVREADQIVVLDRGQIQEIGDHRSLLHKNGIYARLNALQETGELLV